MALRASWLIVRGSPLLLLQHKVVVNTFPPSIRFRLKTVAQPSVPSKPHREGTRASVTPRTIRLWLRGLSFSARYSDWIMAICVLLKFHCGGRYLFPDFLRPSWLSCCPYKSQGTSKRGAKRDLFPIKKEAWWHTNTRSLELVLSLSRHPFAHVVGIFWIFSPKWRIETRSGLDGR